MDAGASVGAETDRLLSALAGHPHFRALDEKSLRALLFGARLVQYRPRRTLLRAGASLEHVLVVLKGVLRAFHRSARGDEVVLRFYRPPALVGLIEVLAPRHVVENVSSVEASEVLFLPAGNVRQLAATRATFALTLAQQLSQYLWAASQAERSLAFCDIDTRLADLLLDYARFAGEGTGATVCLKLPLSQRGIAADLGVTRKSVSRAIGKLRRDGIFRKAGRWYVVEDVGALRARGSEHGGLLVP